MPEPEILRRLAAQAMKEGVEWTPDVMRWWRNRGGDAAPTGPTPRLAYGMLGAGADNPADREALMAQEAREVATRRVRESVKPTAGRPSEGTEALLDALIPQTPLDIGLTLATLPVGGPLTRTAALTLGALLEPSEAQAGKVGLARKVAGGIVSKVGDRLLGRAPAAEIARAAKESAGMTQNELRALYKELGLTGQPPSELVAPSLRSQPPEEIARATALKLADREALSKLPPEDRKAFQQGKLPGFMLPSQEAATTEREAFAPVRKEVVRAEKAFEGLRAQGREPRIFDLSPQALLREPDVEQFPLPRVAPKMTERLAPAASGGLQRIESAAARAAPEDWGWYNIQEPLGTFAQHLDPEIAAQAQPAWVSSIAGTSMLNPIEANVRSSSEYLGRILRGEPLPQVISIEDPITGKTVQTLAGGPPAGYGAKSQIQHAARVREYLENAADPVANAKPFSYRENLAGNYSPRTIDTHDIRNMVGMPYALEAFSEKAGPPLPGEYAWLERLGSRAAERANVPQAMQQGATWIGGSEYTGLKSQPIPLADVLNRRVHVTAAVRGITPEEAWIDHITGRRALLGLGGATLASPMLESAGEEQPQ